VLPAYRPRQERTFPSVTPDSKFFYLIWPEVSNHEVAQRRAALSRLAANVISIGHPSSLARVALCDDPPQPSHRPALLGEPAEHVLRVPSSGRLQALERAHSRSEHLDEAGRLLRYTPVETGPHTGPSAGVFGEIFVSSLYGPAPPLEATLRICYTLRASLMKHAEQPPLEILSGHQPNGRPSSRPHIAIIPFAFVDERYADGSIKGLGLILPRGTTLRERRHVLQALARIRELVVPGLGTWQIEPFDPSRNQMVSLKEWNYVKPSKDWATVTPIILDRFPKKLVSSETEEIIGLSCERIGLPRPCAVSVCEISAFKGVPPSFAFPALSLSGKPVSSRSMKGKIEKEEFKPRLRIHAQLQFLEPVSGPVMLGAGRFFGMGLCRAFTKER
jgi:CRISPR-associated protein Csb2